MTSKVFLFLLFFFNVQLVVCQIDDTLPNDNYRILENVNVLVDKNYSFLDILNNSNLRFIKSKKISVKGIDFYWIKYTVKNNSAYDKKYAIWAFPWFDNTLYSFNHDSQKWTQTKGGEMVANNRTAFKYMPCVFKSKTTTTFYIKVSLNEINKQTNFLNTSIGIENHTNTLLSRKKNYDLWLVTMSVLIAFLIYNAYWYFMIKEKVYLYYLIILFGGMVYTTCLNFFLSFFINFKSINATITSDGYACYIPVELIIMQISIFVILFGFIAFTRAYLQSKIYLPLWDKILKAVFVVFAILILSITIGEYTKIITYKSVYTLVVNISILFLFATILIVGFKSYLQKRKEATYFLLALIVPILVMIFLVFNLTLNNAYSGLNYLPNFAVFTITLTFAVALVAKVNLIKAALIAETAEKQNIAATIAIERERNMRLEEKIEYDKSEVAAAQKIKLLMKELHHRVKNNLQIVSSLLSLQSFRIKDQAAIDAVKEGQHRIEAMSLIHQRLYIQDNVTQVNIKEFIADISESLMQAYGFYYPSFKLELSVTDELIEVDKAIPLSIIINELITNAFKYAYEGIETPSLKISLTKQLQNAELIVSDNGTGIDLNAWQTNDGYGKELVNTFTERLEGTISLRVNNGTTFTIVFPY